MNKNIFSAYQLNTWQECQKKYYFKYIKNLNWATPSSEASRQGNDLHNLIYYYIKGYDIKYFLKDARANIQQLWQAFEHTELFKMKPIAAEYKFFTRIADTNYWIQGRIDAIFFDKNSNKHIIADWKTGQTLKISPTTDFQSLLYLYATYIGQKNLRLSIQPEDLIFKFVKLSSSPEYHAIDYSSEIMNKSEESLIQVISQIEKAKVYTSVAGNMCSACKYIELCH